MQLTTFFYIGIGGFFGANLRYIVSTLVARAAGEAFPWGTFTANLSGSLLLAMFLTWSNKQIEVDPRIRFFIATGFFGAYTTFSTYANESYALYNSGDILGSIGNIVGTNLICLLGVILGIWLGSRL